MATLVLSNFTTALSTFFDKLLARQFNRNSVTAELLQKRPVDGKAVNWDVRVSRTTPAANFVEGSDVDPSEFNVDPTIPATLPLGMYRSAFALSNLAVAAAAKSYGSPDELLNQFESNLQDALSDLVYKINTELFVGTGTNNRIAGLIIGGALGASGTYAGIDRTTYPEWASNVSANAGVPRALTKNLMDVMESQIYTASGRTPSFIVTSPGVVTKYKGLFETPSRVLLERGDISAINPTPTVGTPWIPSNTGYTGLSYEGIPIYRDRACPTGKLLFLNSDAVEIRTMDQLDLGTSTRSEDRAMGGSQAQNTGIYAHVEALAKTGDAHKFQVTTYLQLQVRRPNYCGVIADITE